MLRTGFNDQVGAFARRNTARWLFVRRIAFGVRLRARLHPRRDPPHPFDDRTLRKVADAAKAEVDDHLMVLQPLAALHRAEVAHQTIVTVAHPSQSAIPEHPRSMHCQPIPSILTWLFESHLQPGHKSAKNHALAVERHVAL